MPALDTKTPTPTTEQTQSTQQQESVEGTQQQIDYNALAQIIDQRVAHTSESALKGALKSKYGLDGSELESAINSYKSQKEEAARAESERVQNALKENAQLKLQILNAEIDKSLFDVALKEGVANEKLPFLKRLINRDELVGKDGKIAEEKVKDAIDEVVKAFPDFKTSASAKGITPIVGAGNDTNAQSIVNSRLDAIFGIKK